MRILAVTGSRADWGLISMPLRALEKLPGFEVLLLVTGQHLAGGDKASLGVILSDGFSPDAVVDIEVSDDTAKGVARSAGLALAGIAAELARLSPDLVLVLGDRYEILSAAFAAQLHRVPVAHICGGDITEGAMDDAFRHAISKLSHIHLVTNEAARRRLIQLGEDAANVHCVGSPGLDLMRTMPLLERGEFFASVGLAPRPVNLLVTYHPVTLDADPLRECGELLAALAERGPDTGLLFTGSNADPGARGIDGMIAEFVSRRGNAVAVANLGSQRYFSALSHCDAVVGNSSSGLYEAPSFGKPTINVGDRQKGRLRARSVIDCPGERKAIEAAIEAGLRMDLSGVENPYGDGHASERIVAVLKNLNDPSTLIRKRFNDTAARSIN